MPNNFIEGDDFDPAYLAHVDSKEKQTEEISQDTIEGMLRRRKVAYANVFNAGERSQADIDIVLLDMAFFCREFAPTFNIKEGPHARDLMMFKEGRREVFQRIKDFTVLDMNALMIKYHNI